jgi:hypothetical protein
MAKRRRGHQAVHPGSGEALYQRFEQKGRLVPEGLRYLNSWIDEGLRRCFQVMECEDPSLLQQWIRNWDDLADFEVIPVLTSLQVREQVRAGAGR